MHYFDWTATTPMSQKALDAYAHSAGTFYGNPSSTHPLGLAASQELQRQRKITASLLGTKPGNIIYTSGGTESNGIIMSSLLHSPNPREVIVSGIEHSAILEYRKTLESKGWKVTILPCPGGYLSPETLANAMNENVRLVTFMKVNNVTGTVLDTKALVSVVRSFQKQNGRSIHIHCDAVQALGKIPFRPEDEDFDSAAFSAHKFCGPRGVGILYNRSKSVFSLSRGGGQEKGLRPGTENLAGICAMNAALTDAMECMEENRDRISAFRNMVEATAHECGFGLLSPSCVSSLEYSPYIICISAKPLPSEVFLRIMSDKGFCLSAGSACSSNSRGKAESVLSAMNFQPEDRMSSIRISFGKDNSEEEVQGLCRALEETRKEFGYGL